MLGCCAVKAAALRPTCACSSLHLPVKAASRLLSAQHPQFSYRPNRHSKWRSLIPRALLPQNSEEKSEETTQDPAAAAFISLLQECSGSTTTASAATSATTPSDTSPSQAPAVALRPGMNGRSVVSTAEIPSSGKVIFNVPLDTCLVMDYSKGLQLPAGTWPRVKRGLAKDDALPWDIIHALALLDGLAGDGNAFWSTYTNELLPAPEMLTLPVCLPENLLVQLEHEDIIEAAKKQKQRLAELFPGLAVPIAGENGPTYVEWAFACVRSRAFRLGEDIFAFIPFFDSINHSIDPNTNFEMSPTGQAVNLVSLKEIKENEELTISYTGKIGYTNQRFMAQYGFVPQLGNPFDIITFHCIRNSAAEEGMSSDSGSILNKTENSAADNHSTAESIKSSTSTPVLLSLDALMNLFGDGESMVDAFSGRDAFMYAALKSLPLATMESDAAPIAEQLELAKTMLEELENEQMQWKSSIEEDAALLLDLIQHHQDKLIHGAAQEAASEEDGEKNNIDPRFEAVVRYRLYRKKLIDAGIKILRAFIRGS